MKFKKKKLSLSFLLICIVYVTFLIFVFDTNYTYFNKSDVFLRNIPAVVDQIYVSPKPLEKAKKPSTMPPRYVSSVQHTKVILNHSLEIFTKNQTELKPKSMVPVRAQKRSKPYVSNAFSYPLDLNFEEVIHNYTHGKPINAKIINPHPFEAKYEPDVCRKNKTVQSKLLIIVKSSAPNGELRKAIRHTWGANLSEFGVEIFFSIGIARKLEINLDVAKEQKQYRDILLENFYESYFNVTYKTIMGFNWAVKHCMHINFILFVDDDHLVYVRSVLNYIKNVSPEKAKGLFAGFLLGASMPFRDESSKWYISVDDYPYSRWPPYLAGGAYIVSNVVAQKFVIAFPYIKSMTIDDSWLGIVAKKVGIKPSHNSAFKNRAVVSKAYLVQNSCFASHGFKDPKKMYSAWQSITK